jgi:hypothetical protein
MKRGLLGLQPRYQFLDPIKYWLIRDAGRHDPVVFDLLIDFDALFAHGNPPKSHRRETTGHLLSYDGGRAILFIALRVGYARFGTMRPWCISWVTAVGCFGIELTSLGPLQSSTP